MPLNSTPELEQAIAIVKSKDFSAANHQTLLQLLQKTEDTRIGDMLEAFIAASPSLHFNAELGN